ncbi:MAG: class I SAM-dependent methyltransferase [Tepidisphaeraceae bacterium]
MNDSPSTPNIGQSLRRWLAHPLTRGLDVDDPRTTELRKRIIAEKPFLRRIYQEWYEMLAGAIPPLSPSPCTQGEGRGEGSSGRPCSLPESKCDPHPNPLPEYGSTSLTAGMERGRDQRRSGAVLELGSGAGFLDQYIPGLITSDLFPCPGIKCVLDGQRLPLADATLRAIVMIDVLHHLPHARLFFAEAARCVRPGGVIAMIEPWNTPWAKWVYQHLHAEPFETESTTWEFPAQGPLSGANMALPWIILQRDRAQFEREFPQWRVKKLRAFMPFRYLVSGGVGFKNLMPSFTFSLWRGVEKCLSPLHNQLGMFVFAVLERSES